MRPVPRSVLLGLSTLATFVLVTWALSQQDASLGWAATQIFWFLVVFLVVIPIHELGHAVAGLLVGHRIRAIAIGVGKQLLAFDMAGVSVRINLLPFGGLTQGIPRSGGWLRLRLWVFAAGGPAANVALCYVLHRLYGSSAYLTGEEHRLASVAASASWTLLFLNLIPFRTAEGAFSDGYTLFTLPFRKRAAVEELRIAVEALPLIEALRRDDEAAAAPLGEALEARFGEYPLVASLVGSLRHRQRRHHEAIALWRRALQAATQPRQIAFLKNNIAFAEIVLNDPAAFSEADVYSMSAYGAHPELAAFNGTRGAVLVRVGRPAEALPFLRRAMRGQPEAPRSQAYNKASLASALAMLGRAGEARRELDEARRLNPECELLAPAEADLLAAPVDAAGAPPAAEAESRWEAWGGLPRWQQVARVLAFCFTLVSYRGVDVGAAALFVSIVVLLSPEITGVLALGICNLWIAVVQRPDGGTLALTLLFGVVGVGLAAVRPQLGPAPRSKVAAVLAWVLGVVAVLSTVFEPFMRMIRLAMHGIHGPARLTALSFRPSSTGAVALAAWAAVLAVSRRRGLRPLALAPLALAAFGATAPRVQPQGDIDLRRIPVDGAPIIWSAPRPATVLRSFRVPTGSHVGTTVLSPNGRLVLSELVDVSPGKRPRLSVHIEDADGRDAETDATGGTFVDDEHVVLIREASKRRSGVTVIEAAPFALFIALWSREVPELGGASVEVEPDGRSVLLTGAAAEGPGELTARLVLGATSPAEIARMPSKYPDADFLVGISRSDAGGVLGVVSRQRLTAAAAKGSPFASTDDRDEESRDLELWLLGAGSESLLAEHLPHPDCLHPARGRPALWCTIGWNKDRALLKIDPLARRVARIDGALPPLAHAALLGPSKLAVLDGEKRLGVVDLDTRQGTWLTLPPDRASRPGRRFYTQLAQGGLGVITRPSDDQAVLTVYAAP